MGEYTSAIKRINFAVPKLMAAVLVRLGAGSYGSFGKKAGT